MQGGGTNCKTRDGRAHRLSYGPRSYQHLSSGLAIAGFDLTVVITQALQMQTTQKETRVRESITIDRQLNDSINQSINVDQSIKN